jgi:hypothetical protein
LGCSHERRNIPTRRFAVQNFHVAFSAPSAR